MKNGISDRPIANVLAATFVAAAVIAGGGAVAVTASGCPGAQVKGGGSAGFGEQLAERTAAILSAPLTRLGARSIGVETFEIDPNADIARSQVYFGHTFLPNLYGYGNFGLSGQEVGFEAMLTRGVTLQGRLNEDKLYSMFFHFGWDY